MSVEELKNEVRAAVFEFINRDIQLLGLKVYEPAVSHRIAVYLERRLNKVYPNFDCEYDKSLDLPKSSPDGRGMRPDIVVHKRNTKNKNILVIEVKKSRRNKWDEQKLVTLTQSNGEYEYELGVFIYFPNNKPIYKWFIKGKASDFET